MELNQDSGLTEEEAEKFNPDQPYVIYVDGKDTQYYCFRYPDENAPLSITQISILDEEYDVFGVHLGDNVDDSISILQDYVYKKNEYPPDNAYKYVKGDINIILVYEGDTITKITVSLNADTANGVTL